MNVLWEMAACERVLHGVLEGAKGLIHGVTCGAGMPYRLAEICARYGVYYYPIVSSARAFNALWRRAYHKFREWLGGVVYEDPCSPAATTVFPTARIRISPNPLPARAGAEKAHAQLRLGRCADRHGGRRLAPQRLERLDRQQGSRADRLPVRDPTAPHQRKPDPRQLEKKLLELLPGDVILHRFSPTGFYSSAVRIASCSG